MTQATERLFSRLDVESKNWGSSSTAWQLGYLKSHLESLAQRFPEVEKHLLDFEENISSRKVDINS